MNELLSQQSRCIAHEIRNHISICELYTRIIKKNLENEGIKNESVENAINCITKSLKIMNNSLLDLKSLNNYEKKVCNLKSIVEAGIQLSIVYICDKDIKINCDLKSTVVVLVDENKFFACIVNIIKNAIEAIPQKGEINVSLEIKDSAVIKISNNGEPIKNPDKIFNEGFTTKQTGSGLGLHICAQNLKAQDAELKLTKSTPEITEFEIILPIYKN